MPGGDRCGAMEQFAGPAYPREIYLKCSDLGLALRRAKHLDIIAGVTFAPKAGGHCSENLTMRAFMQIPSILITIDAVRAIWHRRTRICAIISLSLIALCSLG